VGNEAKAEQAGTERCQDAWFRNRNGVKIHSPGWCELQGEYEIIEVFIGSWL